jgi:putative ABC transport system permease protein
MRRVLVVKLVRDLAAVRGRIALMAVAIGVSLVVFGAVLYTGTVVDREFDAGYLGTDPAAATLLLDQDVDPQRAAALAASAATAPGVADASVRTQLTTRFAVGDRWADEPMQLFLTAPDDPLRFARFTVDQGSWPPPPGGVLIERAAAKLLDLSVGDRITVRAPEGTPTTLAVTGIAHDPSLADARQEKKGYGYATTAVLTQLGLPPVLDELKIATVDPTDRDAVVGAAGGVADRVSAGGVGVSEIQVPPPGRQPHRQWVDLILRVLFAFGGAVLLLSGVLAATMLNRLLGRQIPQIGIMKAIGARTGSIVALYLGMTLIVSALATAAAAVPALVLGRGLATAVLGMYDMDPTDLAVPGWSVLLLVAVGLLLAPTMVLVPVLRASRTTVRQAMDHHGASAAPVVDGSDPSGLGRALARVRWLDRSVSLGLRNAVRRRTRFVLLVALLALAGGLFVGGASALAGLGAYQDQVAAQQSWDVDITLGGLGPAGAAASAVAVLPDVAAVETSTVLPVRVARDGPVEISAVYPDQGHGNRFLAAVPPTTAVARPPLVEGRWLQPGDTDAVVLNRGERGGLVPGVRVGDTVRLTVDGRDTTWRVVGLVAQKLAGPSAFVSTDGFAAATGRAGLANRVEVVTGAHDPVTQAAVADRAGRALTGAGFAVQATEPIGRLVGVVDGHVYVAGYALLVIAVVMAIVGSIGMASGLSSSVLERTREFGVMHAIGAPPGAVRRIVVAEGLLTGVVGVLLGAPVAVAVAAGLDLVVGDLLGGDPLPLRFSGPAAAAWLAVVLVGALLATLPPARRASRLTVRQALAYL